METTLSGRFTEFSARFSHADELGGRLTSLIDAVNTHFLVRDVRVDLPGRDSVRDFLALDGGTLRLYESDSVDTLVTDRSPVSALTPLGGDRYALSVPLTAGPLYVQMGDPAGGSQAVRRVIRSDGKVLPVENGWTSKTGDGNVGFQHFLNVFDVNGGGTYTIQLDQIPVRDAAPVLQFVADRSVRETERISFIVEATDPNGTIPALTVAALPVGATFVDQGNGVGVFDWTPSAGEVGSYPITYRASDGVLSTSRTALIHVVALNETVTPGTSPTAAVPTSTPVRTATETPTAAATETDTATPTATPTQTPTEAVTATATDSATPTDTATATPTATPTYTMPVTDTPTAAGTGTGTPTSNATPTATPTEAVTATASPNETDTATATPTATPSYTARSTATETPTAEPTETGTAFPTATPTNTDTETATTTPTENPTQTPTATLTVPATATPTDTPTHTATSFATVTPTQTPTAVATATSTHSATTTPSVTAVPTETSTHAPTATPANTVTITGTTTGTVTPTATPTATSVPAATQTPTATPTASPPPVPTCVRDGVVEPGELCDDGNRRNGDGCDNNCTPTGCGNGLRTTGELCDDGNLIDGDGCENDCTPTLDSVVLPIRPVNVGLTATTRTVNINVTVRIRNAVTVGAAAAQTIRLTADPGDCPAGLLAGLPDFDPTTPVAEDAITLAPGANAEAAVPLEITSSEFSGSFNRKVPVRCTMTFTSSIVPAPVSPDPSPQNNTTTLEVSVTDAAHPATPRLHETYIKAVNPLSVTLRGGAVTRQVSFAVGNGDAGETAGHLVTVTASDGTCPPGTVGVADLGGPGMQPSMNVKGGKTQSGSLPLTIDPAGFFSVSGKSRDRCTAEIRASGPSGDTERSNDVTRLVIDVTDQSDF